MHLEIVEGKKYLSKLRKYFSVHLRGRINYQHFSAGNYDSSFDTEIHFHEINNFYSIYYYKDDGIFYFGLGSEIENFVNQNTISKIPSNLNVRLKVKQAVKFAQCDDSLFLIMPIDRELISDKEYASLEDFVDIIKVNNQEFINFGEIKSGIHILKNIRNFMKNISVDTNFTSILKLIHVPISHNLDNSQFCKKCGNFIEESYAQDVKLIKMVGINPSICAECFSKNLLDYFLLNTTELYLNKENLEIIAENDGSIKFYLELFERHHFFDDNGFLSKNSISSDFSPKNYILAINRAKRLQKIMDISNDIMLLGKNNLMTYFDKLLLSNNLNYIDAIEVQNQVKSYILHGKIKYKNDEILLKEEISAKINYFVKKVAKRRVFNIFKIINILNDKTLNSFGGLDEEFSNQITSYGLDNEVCWKIRDIIINKINKSIINELNFQKYFDNIMENTIRINLDKKFSKKEYYCFDNKIFLKTIINYDDMLAFMGFLKSIENYLKIINFSLIHLNDYFFKITINFQLQGYSQIELDSILIKLGFNKIKLIKVFENGDE